MWVKKSTGKENTLKGGAYYSPNRGGYGLGKMIERCEQNVLFRKKNDRTRGKRRKRGGGGGGTGDVADQ